MKVYWQYLSGEVLQKLLACQKQKKYEHFSEKKNGLTITFTGLNEAQFVLLRNTRRYSPLSGPTSSSCGGLRPLAKVFLPYGQKKRAYYAVLAHF